MSATHPVILLTRPKKQAEAFGAALKDALGEPVDVVVDPLVGIEFLQDRFEIGAEETLLLTSSNAVSAVEEQAQISGQTALCIGDVTAAHAAALGLNARKIGNTVLEALENLPTRFTWVRGKETSLELTEEMGDRFTIRSIIAYRQRALTLQKSTLALIANRAVIAPVFSTNSAHILTKEVKMHTGADLTLIAISDPVAEVLRKAGFEAVKTAKSPTRAAMIEKIADSL